MNARNLPTPTRPVSDWPARRAEKITRTRTGLGIGAGYVSRPPAPSEDAEAIQRALLPPPVQPIALHEWVLYAIGAGVVVWFAAQWLAGR